MCIVILGFIGILMYHLMSFVDRLQLTESVDGLSLPMAEGWDVIVTLWPAMAVMFLAGILTVLLVMKLWIPKPPASVRDKD